jgi:AcrR family transcriptional regulator
VAKEAGVSPATLVQRFGSKRGLLLAFAAGGPAGLEAELKRIRATHRSPLAAVYAIAACMAAMADTPRTLSNSLAFLQRDLVDPEFHRHALAHSRGMQAGIKTLLEEAMTQGELPHGDARRLTRAVQAIVGGSLLQWAIDREGKVADRLREDLDALLKPRAATATKASHDEARRERRRHPRRRVTIG